MTSRTATAEHAACAQCGTTAVELFGYRNPDKTKLWLCGQHRRKSYADERLPEPAPTGWRARLPIHPAAELFPLMSQAELVELASDIEKNGLKEKVKLIEDENGDYCVLDGRNRLDALELNGADLFDSYPDNAFFYRKDLGDPVAYVVSRNVRRRHMTADGKREVIAALLKLEPKRSNRQIAAMVHADHSRTVAPIRKELEDVADIPHVETLD